MFPSTFLICDEALFDGVVLLSFCSLASSYVSSLLQSSFVMSSSPEVIDSEMEKLTISNGVAANHADADTNGEAKTDANGAAASTEFQLDNMRHYFESW